MLVVRAICKVLTVNSIEGALLTNEYCENCYQRCRAFVAEDTCDFMSKELLYLLEDSFDTKTAIKTGMENLRCYRPYCDELYKGAYEVWTNHKGKERILRKSKVRKTGQATV